MSTKFVSKNSNYMIVLRPGVEGNRNLGTHAIPGLYVKFQAGVVDVKEDSIVTLLREHPSFGTDFVEVKQNEIDPFEDIRQEMEPAHVTTEIKYGHQEGKKVSGKMKMSPQIKQIIESEAIKMLPGLLKSNPKILKDIIMGLAADMKSEAKEEVETETEEEVEVAPAPVKSETKPSKKK